MGLFDFLGLGSKTDSIQEFIANGAVIIDVRSVSEFHNGHVSNAKNIPLNNLESKIDEIKKWNKPIIVCCLSGMRSAQATSLLKQNEIKVINGGGWQSLKSKL
ncbi:rhodanese-like domain-containing protein [Flavobacterium myungsuense]|uniref:Rhodanese-like domain-containing protein n=1 Tax=Flavobacterium myungsuense TaxID=651823 RepID=A0ABW3J0T8_9FLAO